MKDTLESITTNQYIGCRLVELGALVSLGQSMPTTLLASALCYAGFTYYMGARNEWKEQEEKSRYVNNKNYL